MVSRRNGFDKGECRAAEMDPLEIGNLLQDKSENRFTNNRSADNRSSYSTLITTAKNVLLPQTDTGPQTLRHARTACLTVID
jgi:hypothetical protein